MEPINESDAGLHVREFLHSAALAEQSGEKADLESAIFYGRIILVLLPSVSPLRALVLFILAQLFEKIYRQDFVIANLETAIICSQKAVDLTPAGNADRALAAFDLIPAGNPDRAGYLNNLSIYLSTRYAREGKPEDLAQAIKHNQEAVDLTPIDNSTRADPLNNLSNLLSTRYESEQRLEDLNQAIKYSQEAVDLTSTSNLRRALYLNNLSIHLGFRYQREKKLEDIAQAIEYSQEAVGMTPADNPGRAGRLNNFSIYLINRYKSEGRLEDLAQAIKHSQEAVNLISTSNPERAQLLYTLSDNLNTRYMKEKSLEDLDQAIQYDQEVVNLTSASNPKRADFLNRLGYHLSTRYESERRLEDLTQAIEHRQNATNCLHSPPSTRISGCLEAIYLLTQLQRWQEARALLGRGLEILPLLISNLSSKLDQENMMKSISGLAAIGCAVSLECSDAGFEAIRVLELTRGTINRLATNSTAEGSMLYRSDPRLAEQSKDLRSSVNAPSEDREDLRETNLSREPATATLHNLVAHAPSDIGFESFLDLPSKVELLENSFDQVTVFLNTTWFRTDAILIHSNKRIQVLPLGSVFEHSNDYYGRLSGRFGYNEHQNWRRSNEDMREFLIWLWDHIVDPILHAFGFGPSEILSRSNLPDSQVKTSCTTQDRKPDRSKGLDPETLTTYLKLMKQQPNIASAVSSDKPSETRSRATIRGGVPSFPRIHWIGVGHMGCFPFHAAGYGSQEPLRNTMSCAISSYASTLTAQASAKQTPVSLEPSSSALLLVAMPKTPGQPDLPGVEKEAQTIQDTLQGLIQDVKLHKLQPVDVILKDLPLYNFVHFACHGDADPQSPFRSGLLLCGSEPEKSFHKNTKNSMLTVETVSSINTQRSVLAFLSACCTAENASSALMDEGIHLAGGFQSAGYPHVIASLWEANDALSVAVAAKFYSIVFAESEIVGHDRIAYALHDAVLAAQQICEDPLSWATIIHLGP